MQTKLIRNNSENLIVFLTGWGCDDNQFRFMKSSENDVLLCYDYTTLDLDFDFSKYKKHYLITFSAGVFVIGMLKDRLPEFEKTIAINGNPLAYDEYFGLRKEIVDIFNGVTKETALDFRRKYIVYDDEEFRLINSNQSLRSFESCREELASLQKYAFQKPPIIKFDKAILSDSDKIFYPSRQKEYWESVTECIYLEKSAHFPFFKLNNYDEIIKFV